ncbi:MAG: aminoacetone oxidase family FAD-binding enzyme [Bacteroidaceae bacterium]|nr:aminoacetone oxidase family FAD-binding enzyme [Bacteroidaceae bacterium]
MKKIAIIGAGAAGCFTAQRLLELRSDFEVELFEAQNRPLKKVAITGGGRCNLTNSFEGVNDLSEVYPRGHQLMKRLMYGWNQWDTMSWFEEHGVRLVTQDDECVFPQSQRAMEIVSVLKRGLNIHCDKRVDLSLMDNYDAVVVTTGGARNFDWISKHGIDIIKPVPSLFPFRLESTGLEQMSGALVHDSVVSIAGTKFKACGTTLITHNGVSGPAILRLSSHAARYLAEHDYKAMLVVNWLGDSSEQEALETIQDIANGNMNKNVANTYPDSFTSRLWMFFCQRAGIAADTKWSGVGRKQMNRLVSVLTSDSYQILGRVPHKEEFVTAGGVSLRAVDSATLECKSIKGLYFAGEVLDVDGVTGGFNLQAAWTMANAVAQAIAAE